MGCAYYAAWQYFMTRGDDEAALGRFKGLFDQVLINYKATYAAKTTGIVQVPLENQAINLFWVTPAGNLTD